MPAWSVPFKQKIQLKSGKDTAPFIFLLDYIGLKSQLKRFIVITLIFALLSQLSVRVGILGYYLVNIDYISEVLCINKDKPEMCCRGKCHLKDKLDQQNDTERKTPVNIKQTSEILFVVQRADLLLIDLVGVPVSTQLPPYRPGMISDLAFAIFHPPKAC